MAPTSFCKMPPGPPSRGEKTQSLKAMAGAAICVFKSMIRFLFQRGILFMKTAIQHQYVKNLSDQELIEQTEALVQNERQTTVQILRHLREIEVRRLFVELGFSSM